MRTRLFFVTLFCGWLLAGCTTQSARLIILSESPVTATLNQQDLGQSPIQRGDLTPGAYTLLLKPTEQSLAPYQHQLTLQPRQTTVVHWSPQVGPEQSSGGVFSLEPLNTKTAAELFVTVVPENAEVTFDGANIGSSPVTHVSHPGEHTLTVRAVDFTPLTYQVSLHQGYRTIVQLKLGRVLPGAEEAGFGAPPSPLPTNVGIGASPSALAKPTPTPKPTTASSSAIPLPRVLILPSGLQENGVEGVRVRATPSTTGNQIGFAIRGERYRSLNQVQNGWHQIEIGGSQGWVSGEYVQVEK